MEGPFARATASDVKFLPIVAAYARELGIVEEVDRVCGRKNGVSCGQVVLALILDTLSGRSPLFRLQESFESQDLELLLGPGIGLGSLNDDAVGRVLDRVHQVRTGKVLSAVSLRAVKRFSLDTSHVHHDTTSRSVYGDYCLYEETAAPQPFVITFGFSKEHRPDLKQLVHSLLCVDDGIPIYSRCESGNSSDKVINRNLIPKIVETMRMLGRSNFLFVNDSALITQENLGLMDDVETGFRFVSRLPLTFNACSEAISRAVDANTWEDLGIVSNQPQTSNRKAAHYHGFETTVTPFDTDYRALVVHSDAHNERRLKKLDKELAREKAELAEFIRDFQKIDYACLPDAQAAVERIEPRSFHTLTAVIQHVPQYAKGRPKADGTRRIKAVRYRVRLREQEDEHALAVARKEAGCFVLITNEPSESFGGVSSAELLRTYKDQHLVEQNFGFLKDPVIVNSLFLKTPRRIEALGLVLVLALMIWRLMERTMRVRLRETGSSVTGWNKKQTTRPTSFMMTTKFQSVIVQRAGSQRMLANPLTELQLEYLSLLGLSPDVFTRTHTHLSDAVITREEGTFTCGPG
jgi:transposase